ncbi:CaiB/BaiF CoA transferase family protein [Roseovarius atlanticus]|uniref:CaiB/BaiF CoA transferase family protein n=1 Tax=Roseovarius atlanticus TaxID=1641875 RepID=UPI001C93CA97|nr:CaiB/BaiF CoA-transferase family protein [Roseovarius atlanticus]MBY5986964.1 CoA transferase [Roseovarius atlanticus]MBY6125604.1 CoA transferase [Roseovarius atlanticus]MBY6149935.1 CoA transferase [Roseovarius atlanticus]
MLAGIKVVEFEGLGPAPFAAMMLADLGATVTVVQRPGPANPTMGEHNMLDRGKQAITLDLKDPGDLAVARALVTDADALIEGLRPGVMERLGLGPDTFTQSNPELVYGRMTGWGQTGPRAHLAGHDYNYIATAGALYYASTPGDAPLTPPTIVGDIGGGALYLVAGLLSGILNAQRTGKGTVVDAAITDGSAHMMALFMAMAGGGNLSETRGQSLLDAPPWGRTYACADARYLSVQCLEPQFYALFLDTLGLSDDPLFADQYDRARWPDQTARLTALFAAEPVAHWAALFDNSDACVAPVLTPWEAARDPHIAARAIWHEARGTLQPAPAPRFDGQAQAPSPTPRRGQHTEEILTDLRQRGLI